MGRERCLVVLCRIEGQIAHKHITQQLIVDHLTEHIVHTTQLELGTEGRGVGIGHTQGMQRGGTCHALDEVEIAHQVVALLREIFGQRLDECLTTRGEAELLSVERHHIIASRIQTTQTDVVEHTQIAQQTVQHLSFVGTAHEVHARLELRALTGEALQTATHLRTLLEYGHIVTVTAEDQSARQAAEATTYDDYFLFAHRSFRCIIS